MKKICFVIPKVSYDGVARVGLTQAKLFGKNYDIKIISLIKEKNEFRELINGLKIRYLIRSEIISRLLYSKISLDIDDANVIISHNIPSSVLTFRNYKKYKIPYISYIHDTEYNYIPGTFGNFKNREIVESLKNASIVLSNSKKTTELLIKKYGIKATILYPGCYPIKKISSKRENFALLVHSISKTNTFGYIEQFLKAKKNIKIYIVGGKRFGWKYVYNKFTTMFRERVKFIFDARDKDIQELYKKASILIHPSIENFGLSPLEAAANGCPSIIARGSGIMEILKENKEIIVYEEGNIVEMCKIINKINKNTNFTKEIGNNAWKKHNYFPGITICFCYKKLLKK